MIVSYSSHFAFVMIFIVVCQSTESDKEQKSDTKVSKVTSIDVFYRKIDV